MIMRVPYQCYCDGCEKSIQNVKDETDITVGKEEFVLCLFCLNNIHEFINTWNCNLNKLINLGEK